MRQYLRLLALLCLLVALLPAAATPPVAAQPEVTVDEELVLINRDDRITVVDPYTAPGYLSLSWESPQTGFRQVATGDFDGDGRAEILGIRGGEAIVFDPFRQAGEPDVTRTFTATSGQVWQRAQAGRYYTGGRDGLVLVQSLSQGNVRARMIVFTFDPSSGWTQRFTTDLGAPFQGLAAGDVDGDGLDELTGIRSGTGFNQILIFDSSVNWQTVFEGNYSYPWVSVQVGNLQPDSGNRQEIATNRSGVGSNLYSFLVFRWTGGSSLQDVAGASFFPNFQRIALGDVDANNEDEIYLLRPGVSDGVPIVALTSRNISGPPVFEFNELAGQTKFGNVLCGDTDGDGRDEVIVMSSDEYIIYTEPATTSNAYTRYPGLYSTSLSFAVANLGDFQDGPRLAVSPTSIALTLQSGDTATRAVQISNTGAGTLNWTSSVVQGSSWLSIAPTSGSVGTTPAAAQLTINTQGLAAGSYVGTVRISGQAGALDSPQDITVNLTVTAPPTPQLSVTPRQVTLSLQSGDSATRQIQIANTGVGTLNWTATLIQGAPWLSFTPSSGATTTTPSTLTATINAASLAPGSYTGTIRIAGAAGVQNSPQDVTFAVTVTAPPAPRLSVTPTQITLSLESGDIENREIQISNVGAGTLNWTAAVIEGASWLSLSSAAGTAPSTLTATINVADVQAGQYIGKIRIGGGSGVQNSPQDVTINLTVTAPAFSASPTGVTWIYIPPSNPGTRTVTVTGMGVSWHAGVVPLDSMQRIQAAIDAGRQLAIQDGLLVLGDGGEDVPIVDYIDVSPSSSTANQTGVILSLVLNRVPYGLNQAAVVFVADQIASPPAVVVRTSVLRTEPGATDLTFLPYVP